MGAEKPGGGAATAGETPGEASVVLLCVLLLAVVDREWWLWPFRLATTEEGTRKFDIFR